MNDYQAKFVAPEQAVKAVQSGDWVDYGFGAGFPELLDKALAARKGEVKDVKVRGGLVIRPRIEVVEADPEQESFSYYSWHVGDYERKLQKNGLVKFMPVMLRSLPYLYRDKHIRCDVAFVPVSKPDENGYCGLGISNYAWRTIFESARTVIFEINEHYPKLQGVDGSHRVHLSEADYIVEGEHEPLPVRSYRAPSETDIAIAKIVVNEIPDGAGSRQDQRQRLVGHFVQLPCDIGDFPDIKRHFVGAIQQYEHAFFLAASLEPVDALDGFVVSRVASDAPDRVRRIEDDTAFAQHFESLINRFVSHILTSV